MGFQLFCEVDRNLAPNADIAIHVFGQTKHDFLDFLFMNMTDAFAQDKDGGVLDWCRLNDVQIQAWSIVQASWADGTFLNNPKYGRLNETLERIAARYGVSKATIATAWILRHPARIQAIAGTTSCDHLKENIDACRIELTRQEWYDLYMAAEKPLP